MARYRCGKCPEVTMMVPGLEVCYTCFKKNFFQILPTLSAKESRRLADILALQSGYDAMAKKMSQRASALGEELPQRSGTPIPAVSTALMLLA